MDSEKNQADQEPLPEQFSDFFLAIIALFKGKSVIILGVHPTRLAVVDLSECEQVAAIDCTKSDQYAYQVFYVVFEFDFDTRLGRIKVNLMTC